MTMPSTLVSARAQRHRSARSLCWSARNIKLLGIGIGILITAEYVVVANIFSNINELLFTMPPQCSPSVLVQDLASSWHRHSEVAANAVARRMVAVHAARCMLRAACCVRCVLRAACCASLHIGMWHGCTDWWLRLCCLRFAFVRFTFYIVHTCARTRTHARAPDGVGWMGRGGSANIGNAMPRAEDMAAWVPKDGENIDIIAVGMQVKYWL